MTEWQLTKLSEVTSQSRDSVKVTLGSEYPLLGVKWYSEGPFLREIVTAETSKATRFNRVRAGQFIYNRLFAWKGSFGLVSAEFDDFYVSNEFPLFMCDQTRLLPEYLNLHFSQPPVWDYVERVSTGTTASRHRWKEAQFGEYQMALPTVLEQKRIVDVMAAVDGQIAALKEEVRSATLLLALVRDAYPKGEVRLLGDVLAGIDSGKSVRTSGNKRNPGEPAVLKLSAIQLGSFVASEAKHLDDLTGYAEAHLVADGDLLITRASGSTDRIGYATIARGVPPMTYMPDLIWRIRTITDVCHPSFLGHLLCAPSIRHAITSRARGTASMRKINKALLRSVPLPIPSLEAQVDYIDRCDAVARATASLSEELSRLRTFRSTLLRSLLNQEIEIPMTHNTLLAEVA